MRATIKLGNSDRQQDLRDSVCVTLGINTEQYYQLQFHAAEQYMLARTQGNQLLVTEFLKEPTFWSWWRNQYMLIDEYFTVMGGLMDTLKPIETYKALHTSFEAYPDKIIWRKIEDSYMQTIANIINNKTNGSQVNA